MSSPRRRTPEEIAANMERVRKLKEAKAEEEKKGSALAKVKRGQIIIFILAGLLCLGAAVEFYQVKSTLIFLVYGPIISIYLLLGFLYYRNPFVISIIALAVYILLQTLNAVMDPATIVSGFFIKGLIIIGLISAIKYGKDYKEERKKISDSTILDADLE